MTTWESFAAEAPGLAAAVRARFEANKHHVLATLRRDGSPRVSGTEVAFHGADLTLGSMPGAVKALDLRRDGRFALHANPGDSSMEGGDAKLSGIAVEVTDPGELEAFRTHGVPPGPFHLFRLDLREAVLTSVADDTLVIDTWREGAGLRRFRRT
ncbi:pyridoxamine 5'-phosphate oxidase family protein [Thermobifida halotolerans]|uniref:Pyridoxamine 5'-phosphate oxidase family protein n=1 Tax=Thermobifida halotolerans TaxID=483545 RepID=A0A399G600_9ACTN|nr:pyridoxamine 5'-phosphate oxidase family protein [Thermobifida halotolerans]UOE19961.1 pyridoxamine 5'-phosphate oxidase family protein [Thermobifida halotolerans]